MDLATLSDETLLGKVQALAETERFTLTDFLVHLGELDRRNACRPLGYSSAFAYLTRHLGYSESDAMRRVRAARAGRKFPSILRLLARGELHLVGIALLEPFLTSDNHRRLLALARNKSQRDIEKIAAQLSPEALEPRDRIRLLPPPPAPPPMSALPAPALAAAGERAQRQACLVLEAPEAVRPDAREEEPPEPQEPRRLFTFVGSEETHRFFLQARDLLRHRFPLGKMDEVIGEALRLLVERERPDAGGGRKTRKGGGSASRYIPRWVRKEVWRRDGGRCSFVGHRGTRCAETGWLEFDHRLPWSLGGRSDDPENLRLLCRAHNQDEARRLFGAAQAA